jgi:hypothetical protein
MQSRLGEWVLAISRVRGDFRRISGRSPRLLRPRRFTEQMQWRKLFELEPSFAARSGKLVARDFRARRRMTESSHRAHDCRFRHAGACRHAPA